MVGVALPWEGSSGEHADSMGLGEYVRADIRFFPTVLVINVVAIIGVQIVWSRLLLGTTRAERLGTA